MQTTSASTTALTAVIFGAQDAGTLACVKGAQRRVADTLRRTGGNERLARLAMSDLMETLLSRAGDCICESEAYLSQSCASQEAFLAVHLELALATWLGERADSCAEQAAAQRCLRVLRSAHP